MLAFLGAVGLAAALLGALLLTRRGISAARSGRVLNLAGPARLLLAGSGAAMSALEIALLTDDFSLAYVADHHSSLTPFPFDAATAWAALEGSILLWGLVLAVFTWFMSKRYAAAPDRLGAAALAVMGGVAVFFVGLMLTAANPLEVCVEAAQSGCLTSSAWPFAAIDAPVDGPGPNPLLQNNALMAVHPPMLYLGYVGLTVPFAHAIAALALALPGREWLERSRRSTLLAWSFLTLGIVLGGWWAYEVLGWGGYWAWDPVENASLLPWLAATAFLHSATVQRRRDMLQAWNFVLVISAFSLTILGTFLTRSGTISSVHSFTRSAIGPALLAFLALVVVGAFTLFSARADLVASAPRARSFASREGALILNNLLLSVFAIAVLAGTVYPLVLEAITGDRVGVGEPFFNRVAVPLSFALLLAAGLGPATPWGGAAPGLIWRRARMPLLVSGTAGLATAAAISRVGWVVLAVALGAFVIVSVVGSLNEAASARAAKLGVARREAARRLIRGDTPFWAGQVSHIGVVLIALGVAFSANLGEHAEHEMAPGDEIEFAGHTITYEAPFQRRHPNRLTRGARLSVRGADGLVATMAPAANHFGADPTGISTPDVLNRPTGDLYITLLKLGSTSATIAFDTSPLIGAVWLGGLVAAGGGFWAMAGRRRGRAAGRERRGADV